MLSIFKNTLPKGLAVVFSYLQRPNLEKQFERIEKKRLNDMKGTVDTSLLLELLFCFKQRDFNHYTIDIGKQVDVTTGFKNAEDVARRLRRIRQLVKENNVLPDKLISSYKTPYPVLLDTFLVTNKNESVVIEDLLEEIRDSIIDLHYLLLKGASDPDSLFVYYKRATSGILGDVYIILERLFTAALMR